MSKQNVRITSSLATYVRTCIYNGNKAMKSGRTTASDKSLGDKPGNEASTHAHNPLILKAIKL